MESLFSGLDIPKVNDFQWKKSWYQQKSSGMSCGWNVFWIFLNQHITVPSFIYFTICVTDFRDGAIPHSPYTWAAPNCAILSRVKISENPCSLFCTIYVILFIFFICLIFFPKILADLKVLTRYCVLIFFPSK